MMPGSTSKAAVVAVNVSQHEVTSFLKELKIFYTLKSMF